MKARSLVPRRNYDSPRILFDVNDHLYRKIVESSQAVEIGGEECFEMPANAMKTRGMASVEQTKDLDEYLAW